MECFNLRWIFHENCSFNSNIWMVDPSVIQLLLSPNSNFVIILLLFWHSFDELQPIRYIRVEWLFYESLDGKKFTIHRNSIIIDSYLKVCRGSNAYGIESLKQEMNVDMNAADANVYFSIGYRFNGPASLDLIFAQPFAAQSEQNTEPFYLFQLTYD